ncbi:MAG: hypothetical protein QOK18_727 [Mycobacterium sp.]|jgi:hypothetical protein|nr:hypothetical protein [Mycobacterium sp.]MDT7758288.1 hypothetical protein [Mycobacterium sp.]
MITLAASAACLRQDRLIDLTEQVAEFDSATRGEPREEQLAYPGFHPVPVKMASVARPSVSDATRATKPRNHALSAMFHIMGDG